MTLKNNRAPLLYYIKLCAAFQSHWNIQTGVAVRNRSIRVKIGNFLSRVTLKIDVWPWKTIGYLFYTTSSFVHHFKSIGESNLSYSLEMLKSGKNLFFCPAWPWKLMYDLEKQQGTSPKLLQPLCIISLPMVNSNWSYSPETSNLGQNQHLIFSRVTLKFDGWPWRTIGYLFLATSSFVHHFIAIWIQTGVTVRKLLNGVMTSVTLTFDLDLLHGHHVCQWW